MFVLMPALNIHACFRCVSKGSHCRTGLRVVVEAHGEHFCSRSSMFPGIPGKCEAGVLALDIAMWCSTGLRVVVEAHGGHFWSTQGSVQRPLDVTSLRIDAQERMGLQVIERLCLTRYHMLLLLL